MDLYTFGTIMFFATMLLALVAQGAVFASFNRYAKVSTVLGLSGAEVAAKILALHDISDVSIEEGTGFLSDHYNPLSKTLSLSPKVFQGRSISSLGIAAHEVGHAIQHAEGYFFLQVRSALVPITKFSSSLAPIVIMLGLFLQFTGAIYLGIIVFFFTVLFSLITLPVEFDASRRAVTILESGNFLTAEELSGTKKVLTSAALTYVASALMSIAQLLRFIGLADRRR